MFYVYFLIQALYYFVREGGANIYCCCQEGIITFIDWKCPVNSKVPQVPLAAVVLTLHTNSTISTLSSCIQHLNCGSDTLLSPFYWGQENMISGTAEGFRETRQLTKSRTSSGASLRGIIVAAPFKPWKPKPAAQTSLLLPGIEPLSSTQPPQALICWQTQQSLRQATNSPQCLKW